MPVAALAAAMSAAAAAYTLNWLSIVMHFGTGNGLLMRYVVPVFSLGAMGYVFGVVAHMTAPSKKNFAGAVMASVLTLFAMFNILFHWISHSDGIGDAIEATVDYGVLAASAIIAVVERWSQGSTSSVTST